MGGLTGLVSGAKAQPHEIGLSLERMNKVIEIDPTQKTALVESGVALQTLHDIAATEGCHFAVDLGARGTATIGGMISTNAGGTEVLRFGMMREQILGLEAVLADGRIISSLRPLLKNNTGYDLKHLLIGSEGTLGVVTKALVRLQPKPLTTSCAVLGAETYQDVLNILSWLQEKAGSSLTTFEVMWQSFYDHILSNNSSHTRPFVQSYPYTVLIECTGNNPRKDNDNFENLLGNGLTRGVFSDAVIANTLAQRNTIWAIRDDIETLMNALVDGVMFDVSLPLKHIDDYVQALQNKLLTKWPNSKLITFGHVGDGNIHLAISIGEPLAGNSAELERIVYSPLAGLNGSISAEHGIGLDKKPYLSLNRSDTEIALMQQIKTVFDPNNILNPGKIF